MLGDVSGVVLVAPCPKMNVEKTKTSMTFFKQVQMMSDVLGMHVLTGENWDKVRSMICSHLGVAWCQQDIHWRPEFFSNTSKFKINSDFVSKKIPDTLSL